MSALLSCGPPPRKKAATQLINGKDKFATIRTVSKLRLIGRKSPQSASLGRRYVLGLTTNIHEHTRTTSVNPT